jgi:hypothetical protein
MPDNMSAIRINQEGRPDENGPIEEYFYQENIPHEQSKTITIENSKPGETSRPVDTLKDQLL